MYLIHTNSAAGMTSKTSTRGGNNFNNKAETSCMHALIISYNCLRLHSLDFIRHALH